MLHVMMALVSHGYLPTRKVPEPLDPAQPQRTGIPMIRPVTGVGR